MFDSHCHLQDTRIIERIYDVIDNGRQVGVAKFLCCGTKESDWQYVAQIGEGSDDVICAFGVHPWYAGKVGDKWDVSLMEYLTRYPLSAIGEIGLDNAMRPRDGDEQTKVFVRQLEIAEELKRPISIHCRKAWGSLLAILKKRGGLRYGGAIHSYSGSPDIIDELQKLGCKISFSGSILNDNNKRAEKSLKKVSLDNLLVETDCPYMLPEPADLLMVIDRLSEILRIPPQETALITYNNGLSLFCR